MSCVGRLCKDYLYLYNSLPLIPTPPLIMAVNIGIGEAVGCLLPSKPPWEEFSKAVGNLLFLVIFDAVSVVLSGLFLYYSSNINLFQVNP